MDINIIYHVYHFFKCIFDNLLNFVTEFLSYRRQEDKRKAGGLEGRMAGNRKAGWLDGWQSEGKRSGRQEGRLFILSIQTIISNHDSRFTIHGNWKAGWQAIRGLEGLRARGQAFCELYVMLNLFQHLTNYTKTTKTTHFCNVSKTLK